MANSDKGIFYKFRTLLKVFGILVLIAACLSGAWALTRLGPKKVEIGKSLPRELSPEALRQAELFLKSAEESEATAANDKLSVSDRVALMQASVHLNEEALALIPDKSYQIRDNIQALKGNIQNLKAGELLVTSQQAASEARILQPTDKAAALAQFRRAIKLQEEIDDDYTQSNAHGPVRLQRLQREYAQLVVKPLFAESEVAEKLAAKAREAHDWPTAKAEYGKAIILQKKINMDYRSSRYASLRRLTKLENELATMRSIPHEARVNKLLTEGQAAMKEKRYVDAATAYHSAMRFQQDLNLTHPKSRHASPLELQKIEDLNSTAEGYVAAEGIQKDDQQLDQYLYKREIWKAIELLQTVYNKVQSYNDNFSNSRALPSGTVEKIEYLYAVRSDINLLQDRIYGQLVSIPGVENWQMTKTEVPQVLYFSINNSNPSSHQGELYPVDSVRWEDVEEFCQRISWIIARPTRLPKQSEYMLAVGDINNIDFKKEAWDATNSDGETQEIGSKKANEAGFYDLFGNVAEWLQSNDLSGNSEAYLAGGSARTTVLVMRDDPVVISNKNSRNRMVGFRIVVNVM